ncbi:MAG: ActR/RegA family two-component response regulator [Planctomycetota bacterium]
MLDGHVFESERRAGSGRNSTGNIFPTSEINRDKQVVAIADESMATDARQPIPAAMRRVLIVGNSVGLCAALKIGLSHPAIQIRTAMNQAVALEILNRDAIDFVIAELQLAPTGGVDFLESVKRIHPGAIRVLLTGDCDIAFIREAIRRSGVSFFLGVPWDAQSLAGLREELLSADWADSQSSPATLAECLDEQARTVRETLSLTQSERGVTADRDALPSDIADYKANGQFRGGKVKKQTIATSLWSRGYIPPSKSTSKNPLGCVSSQLAGASATGSDDASPRD